MRLRPDTAQARDSDVPHSVVTGSSVQDAVPPAPHPDDEHVMRIADVINNGQGRVLVLSGAGLSTESGIPDYRTSEMQRKVINPIKHHGVALQREPGTMYTTPLCWVCGAMYAVVLNGALPGAEFVTDSWARQRYWARSALGYGLAWAPAA
jgi:hypothetical protein